MSGQDSGYNPEHDTDPLFTKTEVAAYLKVGVKSIWSLEQAGLPKTYLSQRIVRYRRSEVDAWITLRHRQVANSMSRS